MAGPAGVFDLFFSLDTWPPGDISNIVSSFIRIEFILANVIKCLFVQTERHVNLCEHFWWDKGFPRDNDILHEAFPLFMEGK